LAVMTQTEQEAGRRARPRGRGGFLPVVVLVVLLLFGMPWWVLVTPWPGPVAVPGTVVFAVAAVAFPFLMFLGHGRGRDWAARVGDTMLGVVWVLFAWSVLGVVPRLLFDDRLVAVLVAAVAVVLVAWGVYEAMRVPRVRRMDVVLPKLGAGLDGTTVVVLADTHFGPIDRVRWSTRTAAAVNALKPDIVCHAGDIADGTVEERLDQAAPLGTIEAALARVYVTGNHEYFGEAQGWLDHMASLGWEPLHNRHVVVSRGGASLVLAGIDDATARASGLAGHGAQLEVALAGTPAGAPVLLVAHQPRQVAQAAAAGVDLQVSGHTHGGQIWPFHYLVRVDQPTVQGLTRHGPTQLYTTRGTGFWGPPLRVFAPSEITLLTLRAPDPGH
jgi:uncharacterized protein